MVIPVQTKQLLFFAKTSFKIIKNGKRVAYPKNENKNHSDFEIKCCVSPNI